MCPVPHEGRPGRRLQEVTTYSIMTRSLLAMADHLPARPKTDKLDSVWLCKVAERQMLRPRFVPPAEIRRCGM